jgi:hypothetical protein
MLHESKKKNVCSMQSTRVLCGASTSGRKKEAGALRLLDQSKLAVASISTRPCFKYLDLPSKHHSSIYSIGSHRRMLLRHTLDGYLYLHDRVSSLPAGHGAAAKCSVATTFTSRRRQYQGRQYGHNTQPCQGIVALTTFLFFTASGPLHVLRRSTLQQLTVLFIVFTILFVHLHTKACRTMPFTPTLFDHLSSI